MSEDYCWNDPTSKFCRSLLHFKKELAIRICTIITIINIMLLIACASTNNTRSTKKNYSRDRIYSEEIRNTGSSNAYELIQRLRPIWLQGRGPKSFSSLEKSTYPVVYLNGTRYGDINSLSSLSTANIAEILFLNARDATTRFGTGHTSGAILIKQL